MLHHPDPYYGKHIRHTGCNKPRRPKSDFIVPTKISTYLCHRSKNILKLFLRRYWKVYSFDFGTKIWVELLDDETTITGFFLTMA